MRRFRLDKKTRDAIWGYLVLAMIAGVFIYSVAIQILHHR